MPAGAAVTTAVAAPAPPARAVGPGLAWALVSAASFGIAGPLARALLDAGWSPSAVALVRIGGGAAVLVPVALWTQRAWRPTSSAARHLLAYGVVAIAGVQICFFSAVRSLDVAVALLVEYTAPLLLLGWTWARTSSRPSGTTLAGAVLTLAGLVLVLDVTDAVGVDPVGLGWAVGAAVCLSGYFLLSDGRADLPPAVVLAGGTATGAAVLVLAGALGIMPLTMGASTTTFASTPVSWLVPAILLVLVSTVTAYLAGVVAVRSLGSRSASFVALTEVLVAAAVASALLGQDLSGVQALGAALVLAGVALTQSRRAAQETPAGV